MYKITKNWSTKLTSLVASVENHLYDSPPDDRASLVTQMVKNLSAVQDTRFDPWVEKIPWRKEQLPTPVFWPGEFHGLLHGVTKSWKRLNDFHLPKRQNESFTYHLFI